MLRSCARAAETGQRLYLYGGRNQGALVQLALNLRQRFPGLKIVGGYSPPHRPLTELRRAAVIEEINRSRADVVWVGIGVPKQEKWMAQMRADLEAPVLIGVGAAFDFHAGLVPQAPSGFSASGSSGPIALDGSRVGCGVATSATTRGSWSRFTLQLLRHQRAEQSS